MQSATETENLSNISQANVLVCLRCVMIYDDDIVFFYKFWVHYGSCTEIALGNDAQFQDDTRSHLNTTPIVMGGWTDDNVYTILYYSCRKFA